MPRFSINPRLFRAGDIAKITGFSESAQRDIRRNGYVFGDSGGWTSATAHDLAKLLLVRTLRDSGIELQQAWQQAGEEVIGNIVLHALALEGALATAAAVEKLRQSPTLINKWKMEFAASRVDGVHVGGGDYYVFGAGICANQYLSVEDAIAESRRVHWQAQSPPLVAHVVMLRELSKLLVDRAGEIAFVVREED